MEGFFTTEQVKSLSRPDGKVRSCLRCGRSSKCSSPKIPIYGEGKKKLMIVLPYPSEMADKKGQPCGQHFRKLQSLLKENKIDIHTDCWVTYAVRCSGTNILGEAIECCRRFLLQSITHYAPSAVLIFGMEGVISLIGSRWKKDLGGIEKWQGWQIPDQELKTFLCPTYSLHSLDGKNTEPYEICISKAIHKAVMCLNREFPAFKEPEVVYLEDLQELNTISAPITAFDYEATGKKPHGAGHKIVCASIAVSPDKVYTFLMPKSPQERKPFTDYLKNENICKMAHNMKYEDTWSRVRLRTEVKGWSWDSMLAAHIEDNRSGICSLKFQIYIKFGIVDYDSEINPYLRAEDDKDSNAINKVEELLSTEEGTRKLLKYCAWDSALQYRLAMWQRQYMSHTTGQTEISPICSDFMSAYTLMHEGALAFSKAEGNGLRIDVDYIHSTQASLTRKADRLERKIKESDFFKKWSMSKKTPVNIDSNAMLAEYLYNVLKIEPKKFTDKGTPSTDEEALTMLHIPECDMLIQRSKFTKLRDTFLEGFLREQVNGVMHPAFNLHLVKTYRSSSSNPNFQNIPKRDTFAFTTCRNAIYPRKGCQLLEMDFSGMEVSIAACYHKDPNMLAYLNDPTKDMHGDMAAQIWCIDNFDKHKDSHSMLRKSAKNAFVFPQFYGDYYKNNADGLCTWAKLPHSGKWSAKDGIELEEGIHLGQHMISKGIKSFDAFVEHMKEIEDHFWNVRFQKYGEWKEAQWQFYLENGYVPLKTGFVVQGVMNRKETMNYPIQGAASHILLWSFIELTRQLEERGMKSRLVGQIHDAMDLDVHPDELEEVYKMIVQIATIEVRKRFKWINVPLRIDAELCEVDAPWSTKKEWEPTI